MKNLFVLLSSIVFLMSTSLFAFDFTAADSFFAKRENNPSAIASARSLYESGLSSTVKSEKVYAVEQLGKLAYYEGDLLTSSSESSKQAKIFEKCLNYVENINPTSFGKSGAYYYWKATCLAMWGRAAGMFAAAGRLGELKEVMKSGLEFDSFYAGGGMHRVVAGVKLNASWLSGLQDREGALVHIDQAIAKGSTFFNAYVLKAEILRKLNRDDEALVVLEDAKRKLEKLVRNNNLPEGYEVEARVFLQQIKAALR